MIPLTLDNFNLDLSKKLLPIDNTFDVDKINLSLNLIMFKTGLVYESVDNSEPYNNILDMAQFYEKYKYLKISNLFHPDYCDTKINLKLRAVHDYCHILALKKYPDFCPTEFNTISELLTYICFENLCSEILNDPYQLIKYNRFDFLSQTIVYHKYNTFMNKQCLFDCSKLISNDIPLNFSI